MNSNFFKIKAIDFVQFGTLTEEELHRFSVCEVIRPSPQGSGDKSLENTPYDSRMGRLENGYICSTCEGNNRTCPGHFGHIRLPIPVYNRVFIDYILKILQSICPHCFRCRLLPEHMEKKGIFGILGFKRLREISSKSSNITECPWDDCSKPLAFFDMNKLVIRRHYGDKSKSVIFQAGEALSIFKGISNKTCGYMGFNSKLSPNKIFKKRIGKKKHIHQFRPESLIFSSFPITPPKSRPFVIRDGEKHDDDITDKYNSVVKECIKIRLYNGEDVGTRTRSRKKMTDADFEKAKKDLQAHIWAIINNKDGNSKLSSGGREHKCYTQRIQGKEGRVQSNIAGKRVDFSARSVIVGGGILLKKNELGTPRYIAERLTKKEIVNNWNQEYLQKMVSEKRVNSVIRNVNSKRTIIRLNSLPDKGIKFTLSFGDIIERQLRNGDSVAFNRQPTLRTESFMSWKIKIHDDYAFRLSLWPCSAYNADFDGDEMNLHVPQSISATEEVRVLMRAANHIVTGQRNGPICGIIQDGLVGSYLLTNTWLESTETDTMVSRNTFLDVITKVGIDIKRYQNMLSRAVKYYPEYVKLLENKSGIDSKWDIADSVPGKLVASILFPQNFCYTKTTKTNSEFEKVIIEDGILLPTSGPLCKKVIGAKQCSIVHILWKEYSCEVSLNFLSDTQLLIDYWLPTHGFSLGFSDCMTTTDEDIIKTKLETRVKVSDILKKCKNGIPNEQEEGDIINVLNSATNVGLKLSKNSMAKGERNAFSIARNSGAKGSYVNVNQIAGFVGQQNIGGKRIPMTLLNGKRTLPHFHPNDHSGISRGFVDGNYRDGLSPIGVYQHAAGGREGLISTAIKTADTGYIQKRTGRKMEDLRVEIDGSLRNSENRIIQFLYGDDGMCPKKLYSVPGLDYPFFANPVSIAKRLNSDARFSNNIKDGDKPRNLREVEMCLLLSNINYIQTPSMNSEITELATQNTKIILKYLLKKVKVYETKIHVFCSEIKNIYETSKAQYGDMVGLIGSNSIGEPATQMVLNVFHLAGVGGKNVSLGVPRYNELLNATKSKKQKNGSCTIFFNHTEMNGLQKIIKKSKNEKEINDAKHSCLSILNKMKSTFEETTVDTFFLNYELRYLPDNVNGKFTNRNMSPIGILTYEEYKKEWWVTLKKKIGKKPEFHPESWVIVMKFDVNEMYKRKISLDDIAEAIENESEGKYCCVTSPNVMGIIHIYCNFSEIKEYIRGQIELPPGDKLSRKFLLTERNINFFTCRDIAIDYIRNINISGIYGIEKIYNRYDIDTKQWVMDVKSEKVTPKMSTKRYLDILTQDKVNPYMTICDDMHAVKDILGIEAARSFLIEEFTRIISFDGTYVNPRFIQVLADSMVHIGEITAVRRDGISRDAGPIAKIMFEKAIDNAARASIYTEPDTMQSISSSIMFGKTSKSGTGSVQVTPPDKMPIRPVRPNKPSNIFEDESSDESDSNNDSSDSDIDIEIE